MKHKAISIALFALFVGILISPSVGLSSGPVTDSPRSNSVKDAHVEVQLVSSVLVAKPGEPFWIGLSMKMDPHWHVYWRNPGDSGLAPAIKWQLPSGFSVGPVHWPYPKKIHVDPFVSYGYEEVALLLFQVLPNESVMDDQEVEFQAHVDWLACKVECIPGSAELELSLIMRGQSVSNEDTKEDFDEAFNKIPITVEEKAITVSVNRKNITLNFPGDKFKDEKAELTFFSYSEDLVEHSAEQVLSQNQGGSKLTVRRSVLKPGAIDRVAGVLVSSKAWDASHRALEVDLPVLSGSPLLSTTPLRQLMLFFFFAYLGGLILNLMPCVLPVLSLKIFHFAEQAHHHESKIWRHGVVFSLGILSAFWALAGLLITLRLAGQQIGWGFHLQSPIFVIFLILLFVVMIANLLGIFEMGLSLATLGPNHEPSPRYSASFFNGVLATVVATPCTAPFMGTALGFALTQPLLISFLIFTFLGLGMASPYLFFSANPAWTKHIPSPGPWMITLKKFLAMPLLGTVAWLLWILQTQKGMSVMMVACSGLIFVIFALLVYGNAQRKQTATNLIRVQIGVLLILGGSAILLAELLPGNHSPKIFKQQGIYWQEFSEEKVIASQRQGKPVFIDFTAAWCLTCQVNERLVFRNREVIAKFQERGVVALKADWTSRDPKITEALEGYGRNSIPLYVLHGPNQYSKPILLPEIITPTKLLSVLDEELSD